MADATIVKLVLPSQIRLLDLVHQASEALASLVGLAEDDALDLGLAVREAVVNAMTHGNGLDPGLDVEVTVTAEPSRIQVRVRDCGQGFDPEATMDPTSEENRLRTSGRGLLLIRAYVDHVAFRFRDGRGMEVTLTKKVRSRGRASAGTQDAPQVEGRT